MDNNKTAHNHGNILLMFLLLLMIIAAAGAVLYHNKDFQRAHRVEITKLNFYLRDYKKSAKDLTQKLGEKIAAWEKAHPAKIGTPPVEPKAEVRTFEQLLYDQQTLKEEIPAEMIHHQPDEITLCSFSGAFLLNNPLSDKEMVHLANIFRFCDLSSITGLQNQKFLPRITTLLKVLRYNAAYETSSPPEKDQSISAFLYRNDRIQILKPGKTYLKVNAIPVPPYYGAFKAGDFDFTVATFDTPASGLTLASIEPLENFYETTTAENQNIKDIMIFGDFAFQSDALSWDSASLLPTFARAASANKAQSDLLGNFWFKKNDLVEFNGKTGLINIKENSFPSKRKFLVPANKPIWAQFKLMPDDD